MSRVEWSDVLSGRPYRPQSLQGRTEAEQRQLRADWEHHMDVLDQQDDLPLPWRWREKREELARLAAEVRDRGLWFGDGGRACPECAVEQRSAVQVDVVDHEHWREDRRLEHRLADHARIARAEHDGGIRAGTFYEGRPQDPVADSILQFERDRQAVAQLRRQAERLANPPMRGLEAL